VLEKKFVEKWRDLLLDRYKRRAWFYKIPTGKYGGFRPFDSVAAVRLDETDFPAPHPVVHLALEFKVEREGTLSPERLKAEYPHQWHGLLSASPYYDTLFAIYRMKEKRPFFVPMEWEPSQRPWVYAILDFWPTRTNKSQLGAR